LHGIVQLHHTTTNRIGMLPDFNKGRRNK